MNRNFPEASARYEDFRQWIYSGAKITARVAEPVGAAESELEIQARWFGGEFGREFVGVDGERIEIVQFGHWNHASGPDFTEAAVRRSEERRVGKGGRSPWWPYH